MSFPARAPLLPGLPLIATAAAAVPLMHHQPLHQMHQHHHPMMFAPAAAHVPLAVPVTATMAAQYRHHQQQQQQLYRQPSANNSSNSNKTTQQHYAYSRRTREPAGPPVTVFIGNITERAPDAMMRLIINSCGTVLSWKRVQGASGKLQAFGFCEFGNPDAALRAIRLLHELDMADKRLVAKVDSKSQSILDKFKEEKRAELRKSICAAATVSSSSASSGGGASSSNNNNSDSPSKVSANEDPAADELKQQQQQDDYMSGDMRQDDATALRRIKQVLEDYAQDMANHVVKGKRDTRKKPEDKSSSDAGRFPDGGDLRVNSQQSVNLDCMGDITEDKKDLITREIGLFRDKMKRQEAEKERSLRSQCHERSHSRSRSRSRSPLANTSPQLSSSAAGGATGGGRSARSGQSSARRRAGRTVSRSRSRSRSLSPGTPPPPQPMLPVSSSAGTPSKRGGSVESRHRSRRREKSVDFERGAVRKSEAELLREKEEAEEARERKKLERKAREKEAAYQERLRAWELREVKRRKERNKVRERERQREQDCAREAKKLKEFLEDYDDEKDDLKYYKGRELQRRLSARALESEQDSRDVQKEKEELEELRARIQEEGHKHPQIEFERLRREREAQYQPRVLRGLETPGAVDNNGDHGSATNSTSAATTAATAAAATAHHDGAADGCGQSVSDRLGGMAVLDSGTTATSSGSRKHHHHQQQQPPQVFTIDEEESQTASPAVFKSRSVGGGGGGALPTGNKSGRSERATSAPSNGGSDSQLVSDEGTIDTDFYGAAAAAAGAADGADGDGCGAPEQQQEEEDDDDDYGGDGGTAGDDYYADDTVSVTSSTSRHASVSGADGQSLGGAFPPADIGGAGGGGGVGGTATSLKLVKKKLNVKDVFNTEEEDDEERKKRRKLVPIDNDDDSKRKEDKKRLVKKLIDRIPTGKTELFSYVIDWDVVDNALMERRIRPWISKKIAEYIGEPEPTLVDFICSKVLVGSTPQAILEDVQMVLDDEADVFVVKMWRLLIYEIEAKKHGLCK